GDGLFIRHGSGRDARYEATAAGLAALGATIERTRLAYAQDAAGRGWDRQWRLVAFAVPESRRLARDAFRDRLIALGRRAGARRCRAGCMCHRIHGKKTPKRRPSVWAFAISSHWPSPTILTSAASAIRDAWRAGSGRSTTWRRATNDSSTTSRGCPTPWPR